MSEVYEPPMSDLETAIAQAYEQGIKAAREAVVTAIGYKVSDEGYWSTTRQADPIAAIDALRGGS